MARIEMFNERRWTFENLSQVAEVQTNDEQNPTVFQFSLNANPLTRRQLKGLNELLTEVLAQCPEQLIARLPGGKDIAIPKLVPPGQA